MTLLDRLPKVRGRYLEDRDMASMSWLRTGGPADVVFTPADHDDLAVFLAECPHDVPILPVGVCSNMIVRDGGIRGVVIRMGRGFNGLDVDGTRVTAGCAMLDAMVAKRAAAEGLDLTFLRTIPGAIGGAVKMNAGCYGSYMADVVVEARGFDRQGAPIRLEHDALGFGYRSSTLAEGAVITEVVMEAPTGDPDALNARMDEQLAKRAASQPVDDLSCGSTFRNPAGFSSTGRADDSHELKAWKVIDDAGCRGLRLGGAQMSEKHPNFLINADNATSADLEDLGEEVRKRVREHAGIELVWEIMRVGERQSRA
ncbi:UDP-N-acetylmuramate dehydrogenase [Pontivivens insulae]|uniref:UDP-N-acetylenolpyruvoylglucosamine reductase n=1 Tax=Pontivivens insulae TaxID=1639689 RepID=A0A2R8ADG8_9RHOB|nr:UDP-N-acetylmuramate dehydrogenase [Pontivivens insulae]RED14218.1 UDP-N-acetylmuramate dehydrogenase [Pontivivens insulae]SPF30293.1 UDP-N-acetylenolpyruvoylglucosamine reductase [Pontivivens insulae]